MKGYGDGMQTSDDDGMKRRLLTEEERRAVQCLERLAARWPDTIRLVLRQGTRAVRVCLRGDVEAADDLASVRGVELRGLKIESHS